jgi:hypothetical protein
MAVTAALGSGRHSRRADFQAADLAGNRQGRKTCAPFRRASPSAHSTGIMISFALTMFSRLRAAASMARGSLASRSISFRKAWFASRNPWTSVCIRTYCSEARDILVLVRMVTAIHMARVASIIMPKTTHDGITPPRLRTSAGVPMMPSESSLTDANGESARGTTRWARIRSSTQ